jgi:hypothetical protein
VTAYQGARAQPIGLAARRRVAQPSRAGRRTHPVGLLMAGVLVALLLGLVYLGQTVQLAATNYEVDQLLLERDDLGRQVQTLEATVARWGSEPLVLDWAQQVGLDALGTRIRVPAR